MSGKPTYLLHMAMTADPKDITLPRGLVRQLLDMLELPSDSLHEGHEAVIEYVRDQIGDNERKAHLTYLAQFLRYDGERHTDLNPDILREALELCDGYGKTDKPELLYDWSHVRDSSVEALAEARRHIEAAINFKD